MLKWPLGINEKHNDFSKLDGADGVTSRELLSQLGDLGLAPQTCGINEPDRLALVDDVARNTIARQTRLWPGDHAVFAKQRIDER